MTCTRSLIIGWALSIAGCAVELPEVDGGAGLDAGVRADAGGGDASVSFDAGAPFDAGLFDGGSPDAGPHDAGAADAGACRPPSITDGGWEGRLRAAWVIERPTLAAMARRGPLDDPQALYDVQLITAQLLLHAEYTRDLTTLTELAEVYLGAFDGLQPRSVEHFFYARQPDGGPVIRNTDWPLPDPVRFWHTAADAGAIESTLSSSQFLYPVARLVRIVAELPRPPPELVRFVDRVLAVMVNDHFVRWLQRDPRVPGRFQRAGWGCNSGTYSHLETLQHLLHRSYGTAVLPNPPSRPAGFCNAVTDTELWIVAGVVEVLAAHHANPALVPLGAPTKALFENEAALGVAVIRSRLGPGRVDGGLVFDPGAFDEHPDNAYTGYTATSALCATCKSVGGCTCPQFPGWIDAGSPARLPPVRAVGVAWDISHARRLVSVLDTLHVNAAVIPGGGITTDQLRGFAMQLGAVVWNGSESQPSFTNFFDGTNGWYRVNYSGREAFGYPPSAMDSEEAFTSGYGFWRVYDERAGRGIDALFRRLSNPGSRRLVQALPEVLPWGDAETSCPW